MSGAELPTHRLSCPSARRLPRLAGCTKYNLICGDIFNLQWASVEEHLHCGMRCASSDRLFLLHLQCIFLKSAAFLSHVTPGPRVSARGCGGGSTCVPCDRPAARPVDSCLYVWLRLPCLFLTDLRTGTEVTGCSWAVN